MSSEKNPLEPRYCRHCNAQIPPRTATADALIELYDEAHTYCGIVLIERANPPAGWAIPGGFLDPDEDMAHCARREAAEETGLQVELIGLLGVYSAPGRDPRALTVTAVYVARASGTPQAADDARDVVVADPENPPQPLAFDHAAILADYRAWRRGERTLATV
jgi:8-oxo-dGTP diphosphatase